MGTVSTVEARERLADIVNRAAYGKERVALLRHGKPVAVVVPVEDVELLERLEAQIDVADALAARDEARSLGTKALADFRAELGI